MSAQCASVHGVDEPGFLSALELLLRDQETLVTSIEHDERLQETARAMLLCVAVCMAIFGVVLGSFRGGVQLLYAGLKLPLVTLLTLALVAPVMGPLQRLLGRAGSLRRDVTLLLAAAALSSLVLVATAPVVLLLIMVGAPYQLLTLIVVGLCALAGVVGLRVLWRGFARRGESNKRMLGGMVVLFLALVGSQLAWTLRPYLVRPRTPETPFVRSLEGSFIGAVLESGQTVVFGSYKQAPLPGERRGEP